MAKDLRSLAADLRRGFAALKRAETDVDRDVAVQGVCNVASAIRDRMTATLEEITSRDPLTFAQAVREFGDSLDPYSYPDFIGDPAGDYDDLETLNAEWRMPDDLMQRGQDQARELLDSGHHVQAFVCLAQGLVDYYNELHRTARAMNDFARELVRDHARTRQDLLGALGPSRAAIPKMLAVGAIDGDQAEVLRAVLTSAEMKILERFNYPGSKARPIEKSESEPYRRRLGDNLMRLFAAVGFTGRSGPYTRTTAAYYVAGLAAGAALVPLAPNTSRLARGHGPALHSDP